MNKNTVDGDFLAAIETGLMEAGWDASKPLVVAFSGGADSTALLLACAAVAEGRHGQVHAAHFDHRTRDDSGEDRVVVDFICDQLGVPVIAGIGDVPEFARDRSMSLETAARELRYRFLADAVDEVGAQGVATGHTLDDQAETVLMNVLRGAGTRGLAGMRPRTRRPSGGDWPALNVLRPMLRLRHSDCVDVCRQAGIEWLEDPTNRDTAFTRNRVRHELLPLAEEVRPGAIEAVARLADNVREADSALREIALAGAPVVVQTGAASVNRGALRSLDGALQIHVLSTLYESATGGMEGLEQDHLQSMRELIAGDSGTQVSLPDGFVFRVDYETCSIDRGAMEAALPDEVPELDLQMPGSVELPGGFMLTASLVETPRDLTEFGPNVAYVTTSAVEGGARVRPRRDGDRFHPLGMRSETKLQDYFVNAHVPERFRDRIPLVECERGIAWVAGERIAEWAKLGEGEAQAIRLELSAADGSPS